MEITLWCLQIFRDAEGLYLASDSDEQLLIYIPFMQSLILSFLMHLLHANYFSSYILTI